MFGAKKLYFPITGVCIPLSAQRHIDSHGDRHPDRNLACIGAYCSHSSESCHRMADLEISARHRKMVERRSGL